MSSALTSLWLSLSVREVVLFILSSVAGPRFNPHTKFYAKVALTYIPSWKVTYDLLTIKKQVVTNVLTCFKICY
jgi:hypothetical protein